MGIICVCVMLDNVDGCFMLGLYVCVCMSIGVLYDVIFIIDKVIGMD